MNVDKKTLEHANKTQAQWISELKAQLGEANLRALRAEASLAIVKAKHRGLLKEFRAFKALIRHLGAQGTEIEWQEEQE